MSESMKEFLEPTKMLNYNSNIIQNLIQKQNWINLSEYEKIKSIYNFVQNEILFGYNCKDNLNADEVLVDGYGQCNTKATLLMALLRGVNIPCRLHGSEVSKDFQRGVTTALISKLAPKTIIHTWVEVYYNEQWLDLEGVILDKAYFNAIKTKYSHDKKDKFRHFAIATNNFQSLSIEWDGSSTYVQSAAVVNDLGVFLNPDDFFSKHKQHLGKLKEFIYVHIARKIMNKNVKKIRNT